MLVEKLTYEERIMYVGIAELENNKELSKDSLIQLTSEEFEGVDAVQLFDSALIVDEGHLLSAAQNAVNAYFGDYSTARDLGVEIIVYASGQRQINRAIETLGVRDAIELVAVVVIGHSAKSVKECIQQFIISIGIEVECPFAIDRERQLKIMKYFSVGEKEMKALTDSSDFDDIKNALSRCVASRVSSVALDT